MANDLNRSIKIYLDNSSAMESANQLKARIGELEQKLKSLQTTGQGNSAQAQKLTKELDAQTKKYETYKQKVAETDRVLKNLSGSTYNELIQAKKAVETQLKKTERGTEMYNNRLRVHKALTKEITLAQQEMRAQLGAQGSMWSRAADGINRYAGIAAGIIGTITGVTFALNKMRDERDKLEDTSADVKALTGLNDDDMQYLIDQAKTLSSTMTKEGVRIRSSANDILEAYKVVGGAKADLLANKEALAEVTKQTLILATASKMDMKKAAEAAILSMNQYGASAEEASRYVNALAAGSVAGAAEVDNIVNSVVKAGVSAASANIPIEQLVGSIEVLAERGIKDEIAGTGLKRFFLTLQTGADETNPKIVGLTNALETLKAKNLSAGDMKDMFGEQGYNVATVMIDSIDKVKELTAAVTDTKVAVEQAQIVSDTAAAKRAQATNQLKLMGVELIENLNPSIIRVMNSTVSWTRTFIDVVKWIQQNAETIAMLTTFIIAYTVAVKASVIADKLKVLWTTRITSVTKTLYTTMLKNPYALLGAVILTWILHMKNANRELTKMEAVQRRLNSVENEAAEGIAKQKTELEQFLRLARDESRSKDERLAAMKKINDISPEYLGNLTLEEINTTKATTAIEKYIASITHMAKAQAAKEQLIEIEKEKMRLDSDPEAFNELLPWWEKLEIGFLSMFDSKNAEKAMTGMINRGRAKRDKIKSTLDSEAEALRGIIETNSKTISEILNGDDDGDDDDKKGGKTDKSTFSQKYNLRLKELENEHAEELAILKKNKLETEELDELYNLKVIASDQEYYNKRLSELNVFLGKAKTAKDKAAVKKDIVSTETSLLDLEVQKDKESLNSFKTIRDRKLQIEEDNYTKSKTVYERAMADSSLTEEQYKALMLTLDTETSEMRLNIQNEYLSDVSTAEIKSGTLKVKAIEDASKAVLDADLKANQARSAQQKTLQNLLKDFKGEFKLTTVGEDTELQLKTLESAYQARKEMAEKANMDTTELDKAYALARSNIMTEAESKVYNIRKQYGLVTTQKEYAMELELLEQQRAQGLIAEEDYESAKANIRIGYLKKSFDYYKNLFSGAINALQEAELANIDAKYDVEIERALGNSDEVARLENEKEQKKLDVQKKYAGVQFAVKVSEIIANTAVAIMQAYAQLGPIAGTVAAALMSVTGAAQIAIANAERKKIMNMTVSGNSSSSNSGKRVVTGYSEGGYTGTGGVLEVAGDVHRMEYVVPAWEMQEPAAMNHVMALEAIRRERTSANPLPAAVPGFAEGGYTGNPSPSQSSGQDKEMYEAIRKLNSLLSQSQPLKAYVVLSELQAKIDTQEKSKKIGGK